MIKVITIDDERYALEYLRKELSHFDILEILNEFQDTNEAIKFLSTTNVDLIFADIEMPSMSGIDFLKYINKQYPHIKVIFTTAYDHYTLNAFELGAFDYIIKPVLKDRIAVSLQRMTNKQINFSKQFEIKMFNHFSLTYNGNLLAWRTLKAKEIVAYLLLHNDRPIHQTQLINDIWGEKQDEVTSNYIYSIIYYARQTFKKIGLQNVIEYINGYYSINMEYINYQSDLQKFQDFCDNIPFFTFNKTNIGLAIETCNLYTGDLFQHNDYPWSIDQKTHIENQYESLLFNIANYYYKNQAYNDTYQYIKKLSDRNPFNDAVHKLILAIYKDTHDNVGYQIYLKKVRELYLNELGINFERD